MKSARSASSRRRQFEQLEPRLPLAGNVTANLNNGTLTLLGDALSNALKIDLDISGQVAVIGQNNLQGTQLPTSLNAVSNGTQLFSGVTNIVVEYYDGDDELYLNNLSLERLKILAGNGDDNILIGATAAGFPASPGNVSFGSVGVSKELTVDMGAGALETLWLQRVFGAAATVLNLGAGQDFLYLNEVSTGETAISGGDDDDLLFPYYFTANGGLTIDTGLGDDVLDMRNATINRQLTVQTGSGNDSVQFINSAVGKDAFFYGGDGSDTLGLDVNNYGANVTADSGSGDDTILFSRSIVSENVFLYGGSGIDTMIVGKYYIDLLGNLGNAGSTAKLLRIEAGKDDDAVLIAANAVRDFYANLGSGNDTALFEFNSIKNTGVLDGGAKTNKLTKLFNSNVNFYNFS